MSEPATATVNRTTATSTEAPAPAASEAPTVTKAKVEPSAEVNPPKPEPGAAPSVAPVAAGAPTWPELSEKHPLSLFFNDLSDILKSAEHNEVYGITLKSKADTSAPDFHTLLILQKFLRANQNDLTKAKEQLTNTLKWRKEFDPQKALQETFSKEKFGGLGYVTEIADKDDASKKQVVTWNIYGAVKDYEKTFVPLDEFIRWRITLMELSTSHLNLSSATVPIPDYGQGPDPYQGIQVHDYLNVSFLRMDPRAKAASKKTIELLGLYYPETLSRKFFVNVPMVMQWMFTAMSLFISAETKKKFVVLSYGENVKGELGDGVPTQYGGKGGKLEEIGQGVKLA